MLFGVGSIHLNELLASSITDIGIAFIFGGTVALLIAIFGPISGAHINPAVSFGFLIKRQMSIQEFAIYAASQILGALTAAFAVYMLFKKSACLGCTIPNNTSLFMVFVYECLATFILMFVILAVIYRWRFNKYLSGICIGAVITAFSILMGDYTGASLNPARTLAPAIIFNDLRNIWIYISAPLLGSFIAAFIWNRKK